MIKIAISLKLNTSPSRPASWTSTACPDCIHLTVGNQFGARNLLPNEVKCIITRVEQRYFWPPGGQLATLRFHLCQHKRLFHPWLLRKKKEGRKARRQADERISRNIDNKPVRKQREEMRRRRAELHKKRENLLDSFCSSLSLSKMVLATIS